VPARLPGKRRPLLTVATASAFAGLHGKMRKRGYHPSRNWPLRVGEVFERLCELDPLLPDVMIATPGFGEPDHALFAARLKGDQRIKATKAILAAALKAGDDAEWNAQLVELVAELPDPAAMAALREQWHVRGLRDVIVRALAKEPQEADRARFVDALRSPQPAVAALAARALTAAPAGRWAVDTDGDGSELVIGGSPRVAGGSRSAAVDDGLVAYRAQRPVAGGRTSLVRSRGPLTALQWRSYDLRPSPGVRSRNRASAGRGRAGGFPIAPAVPNQPLSIP